MSQYPILIAGKWQPATASSSFRAENPAIGELLSDEYPVSTWADCDAALDAASDALAELRVTPPEKIAAFLNRYAERIEARADEIVEMAHQETGLPKSPRLAAVEHVRTTGQLRLAAKAVIEGSWAMATIDTKVNIRSRYAALGPVLVFGPNNFPFAYNGVSGGDFVSAIAAGNPVIAKAHPSHPGTSRLLAEEAFAAVNEIGLPPATVQMIYHMENADGLRMVSDHRLGGTGFTGSRKGGLALKAAADAAGKPIYLELSSINPVIILPGALTERSAKLAEELAGSCLMAAGQFCTSPGFILLIESDKTEAFIADVKTRLEAAPSTTLLSAGVAHSLAANVKTLQSVGAELITGGEPVSGPGYRYKNTMLRVTGSQFLAEPEKLQTEAFGNASLVVIAKNATEAQAVLKHLEGNLTGSIYSDTMGSDDALYADLAPLLRSRVGRFLNDKMPTGVAVSPAMNHGGPYPSTGHPGFTAVGIPASLHRFVALECYDNVRAARLPVILRDEHPGNGTWRFIDSQWSQGAVKG